MTRPKLITFARLGKLMTLSLTDVKATLFKHGLYVITTDQVAVLQAMANRSVNDLEHGNAGYMACNAELCRRNSLHPTKS